MKEKEVCRFFTHNFFRASVFGTSRYGTGLFAKFSGSSQKKVDADPGRGFEGIVSREQAHEKIIPMSRSEVLERPGGI